MTYSRKCGHTSAGATSTNKLVVTVKYVGEGSQNNDGKKLIHMTDPRLLSFKGKAPDSPSDVVPVG